MANENLTQEQLREIELKKKKKKVIFHYLIYRKEII